MKDVKLKYSEQFYIILNLKINIPQSNKLKLKFHILIDQTNFTVYSRRLHFKNLHLNLKTSLSVSRLLQFC